MKNVFITGTGLYTPPNKISNQELVAAFNIYVDNFNGQHKSDIANGSKQALEYSSEAFIEKASGILSRYVVEKSGILNPKIMHPLLPERQDTELSYQAEMGVAAAHQALDKAGLKASQIDQIIVACSNFQRPYPAISIEIQAALGAGGSAYDMNVACSSATFGIQNALAAIQSGIYNNVLVINAEICSSHLDFTDRDCHFIFGDACTAIVLQADSKPNSFKVLSSQLQTLYSNNIRNNSGFLDRTDPLSIGNRGKLFKQAGRKVFKEVLPMVSDHIAQHLATSKINPAQLKRLWLHQANLSMNQFIAKKVMGRVVENDEAPTILDEYANTSSAGSIIAFHKYQTDLQPGDIGLISSFGAGYSVGSLLIQMV